MRVLHVGLGPLGRMIARDVAARRLGRVVAAVDRDPQLIGTPLADHVDGADAATTIVGSLEEAGLGQPIDVAVVTTSSDLGACAPTFRELLSRGISVVSTCEELLFPWLRHADLAAELDGLARQHGGRLLGTGVNPGFLMDTLPALTTAVCRGVRRIDVWRVQDASSRRLPFQRKIGAALSEQDFRQRAAAGTLRHVGLGESLHFIADAVGFRLDGWDESLEPVTAADQIRSDVGVIPAGGIAGVRQIAWGWDGGGERVRLEFTAAIAQPDPHDRIRIEAEPPIDMVLRGGVHGDIATCAVTLNVIGPLLASSPGLHTMRTIPLTSCRYHG